MMVTEDSLNSRCLVWLPNPEKNASLGSKWPEKTVDMYLQHEAFSRINTMEQSGFVSKFQLQVSNDPYLD